MGILGIKKYPFSAEELSNNFRRMIKLCHPDVAKDNNTKEKAQTLITSYKHLKNLAVSFVVEERQRKEMIKVFQEDEDIFSLWDTCPDCNGESRIRRTGFGSGIACDECDPGPQIYFLRMFFGSTKSSGMKTLKCNSCRGTGKFKQRSGRVVDCYRCKGIGVFKRIRCGKCGGLGIIYKSSWFDCSKCKGLGKIKLNLFNPVIPKGSILSVLI